MFCRQAETLDTLQDPTVLHAPCKVASIGIFGDFDLCAISIIVASCKLPVDCPNVVLGGLFDVNVEKNKKSQASNSR